VSFYDIGHAAYLHPERLPEGEEPALETSAVYQPGRSTGAFSYATHACVVAVDPGTGIVEVLDYVACHDCGTMVNPLLVEAQVVGGIAQGIGTALYEESPYDTNGQPLATTFLDYMIPGATEVPDVRVLHMETPSPHTRFGIKGMGEGGADRATGGGGECRQRRAAADRGRDHADAGHPRARARRADRGTPRKMGGRLMMARRNHRRRTMPTVTLVGAA
jgi:CO/xanthine dehydrogenase Mo-binding subunit